MPAGIRKWGDAMKSFTIKRKLMCFVLGMFALILTFCVFLGINNQSLFQQQSLLLTVQEDYDTLKDGFTSTDSLLFSYAQSRNDYTRTECLAKLDAMDAAAQMLCEHLSESIFNDLQILTQSYTSAARNMLNQNFSGTEEALSIYSSVNARIDTIQLLFPTYTKAIDANRSEEKIQLEHRRTELTEITIIGAVLMILLFIVFLLRFSGKITKNLTTLTACAEKICRGEWSTSMPSDAIQSRDEVGILTVAFYHMLETIRQQIEQLKKQESLERQMKEAEVREAQMKSSLAEAQLLTLQSRVNPHFLFNALNVIAGQAAEESAFKTFDMIEQTANYLRYSLSKLGKAVTLKEELQNVQDYLDIQKRRFGDRLRYSITVEPSCADALAPSMLLQPICENALIHGIMPKKEGGAIQVQVKNTGENINVAIEDNGMGFEPSQLREINEKLKNTTYCDTDGIGLSNVIQRANQFYGESVQIYINSSPNQSTCVTLLLPYRKKEEKNAECSVG